MAFQLNFFGIKILWSLRGRSTAPSKFSREAIHTAFIYLRSYGLLRDTSTRNDDKGYYYRFHTDVATNCFFNLNRHLRPYCLVVLIVHNLKILKLIIKY